MNQEIRKETEKEIESGSTHHSASMLKQTSAKISSISSTSIIYIYIYISGTHSSSAIVVCPTWRLWYATTTRVCLMTTSHVSADRCNCRDTASCPLDGKSLTSSIVYKGTIQKASGNVNYLSVSESPFKERYNNHTKAFRNRKYEKDTELSKLIWKLKDAGEQYTLSWSIASSAIPYN